MDYKDYQNKQKPNYFWFRGKEYLISKMLSKYFYGKKNLKILNLGAGVGSYMNVLNKFGEVYVVDINEKALELIPKSLCKEKKVANATKLPYKNGFFDLVVSLDVFEHIEKDKKAVSEVRRVLKTSGLLFFSVPAFQFLFSSRDRALNHKRRYNKKDLQSLFSRYDKLDVSFWNFFLFLPVVIRIILTKRTKPELKPVFFPEWIDTILYVLLFFESNLILKGINLPFGISLIGTCKKP